MQRRVLITTLPSILNVVRLVIKISKCTNKNSPLHFKERLFLVLFLVLFFFVSYFVEKKQEQQQNRHGKEKLYCLCRFFFNVTLSDYNKLRQVLVNKIKYKMGKKIYARI